MGLHSAPTAASSASLAGVRQSIELLIPQIQVGVIPLRDDSTWCTHSSFYGVVHDPFERHQPIHDYERREVRLELLRIQGSADVVHQHVGDIVVGYYVTRLIDERYPGLVVGMRSVSSHSRPFACRSRADRSRCYISFHLLLSERPPRRSRHLLNAQIDRSQQLLRSLLVANTTLCLISSHFGFPTRLRASEAQLPLLCANYRVQAAQFEAYLGTLDLEQPREVVAAFVAQIFTPLAAVAYEGLRELFTSPIPLSATSTFSSSAAESSQDSPSSSPAFNAPINYVGKMMEWAMERGHAHQRTVTFRKIEPTSPPAPSPTGGPVLPSSEYELEWRDVGAEGEPLAKGLKVRGEGRTVKVAKAV